MEENWSLLLILLFSLTELVTAQQDVCPPWFVPNNRSNTGCSCTSLHRMEVKWFIKTSASSLVTVPGLFSPKTYLGTFLPQATQPGNSGQNLQAF